MIDRDVPKPNLFIVGAPKAGTSALSHFLAGHPQVFMCEEGGVKEPQYLAPDYPHFGPRVTSLEDYLALFRFAPRDALYRGDASTGNLYSREAVRRIENMFPGSRVVVSLRNPAEIAQGLHNQRLKYSGETIVDFERAWRLQERRMEGEDLPFGETDHVAFQYGTLSKTGSQLKRIFEVLPRERLHIIVYDDLVRDPAAVYARLIKFLGLEHDGRMEFPAINVRVRYRVPALQQALLSVKDLRERLGIPGGLGAHKLIDRLNKRQGVPNLRPAFEAELKEYFREDVQLLSELVQRDFSDWTELKRP